MCMCMCIHNPNPDPNPNPNPNPHQFEAGEWTEDASNPGWGTFNRADGKPSPNP